MRYCPMLLVCPMLTGCFGYCYPSFTHTPAVVVNETDARAFRVKENSTSFGCLGWPKGTCAIDEITCTNKKIPSESYANFNYFAFAMPVIPIGASNSHGASVRLYRRGYQTVVFSDRYWVIDLWRRSPEEIAWKKAETLAARIKAIDDIIAPTSFMAGSTQIKNDFIADEYLDLSNSALASGPEHKKIREQLIERSQKIRAGDFQPGIFNRLIESPTEPTSGS